MNSLKTWHFGIDNDKLVDLVLNGKKIATTYLDSPSKIGEESILIYDNEKKACITKTKEILTLKFKDITWELAKLEGENNSLEEWKEKHYTFFRKIDNNFNGETEVIFEIFEVTKNLIQERFNIATKIVENNLDVFKKINKIEEINAGFNNYLFNINDQYILKICGNQKDEKLFDTEYKFYLQNKNNSNIPTLYKYDKSKKIVNYVYEIIEKVQGKTIYYHWYKWSELERENFIKELVKVISKFHNIRYELNNWKDQIKTEVINRYKSCQELFTKEECDIIEKSFTKYDLILSDNRYALIHNDLHFDNILLEEENIKIIDFNDSTIAPIDYDLRLLFMCKDEPWKWANIEMDPYQKPKDYQNIINYIKKYYLELNEIKYLEQRMNIYKVLNDIRHLERFKNKDLIENIVNNSLQINETI